MGALYASLTLALFVVLLYVALSWGGPAVKGLAILLMTPFLLVLAGIALGIVLGFTAGCSMPWVKSWAKQFKQQPEPPAGDPYETALALAGKLPTARRIPFMYALRQAWGIEQACADMAQEFMARTGRVQ